MDVRTLFLLLSLLMVFGCGNNKMEINQSNTESGMSKPIKNEINMDSYFPSPSSNIGLEDEILQALKSKFKGSSDFKVTILDNDIAGEIKPMYYVWVKFLAKENEHQEGLVLVIVGVSPKVVEYYPESVVSDALVDTSSATNIPKNILDTIEISSK